MLTMVLKTGLDLSVQLVQLGTGYVMTKSLKIAKNWDWLGIGRFNRENWKLVWLNQLVVNYARDKKRKKRNQKPVIVVPRLTSTLPVIFERYHIVEQLLVLFAILFFLFWWGFVRYTEWWILVWINENETLKSFGYFSNLSLFSVHFHQPRGLMLSTFVCLVLSFSLIA